MEKKFRRWLGDCHSRLDKHVRFERIGPPELQVMGPAVPLCGQCRQNHVACCSTCEAGLGQMPTPGSGMLLVSSPVPPPIAKHSRAGSQRSPIAARPKLREVVVRGRILQACMHLERLRGAGSSPAMGWRDVHSV